MSLITNAWVWVALATIYLLLLTRPCRFADLESIRRENYELQQQIEDLERRISQQKIMLAAYESEQGARAGFLKGCV